VFSEGISVFGTVFGEESECVCACVLAEWKELWTEGRKGNEEPDADDTQALRFGESGSFGTQGNQVLEQKDAKETK
jgi:hypothetical protein